MTDEQKDENEVTPDGAVEVNEEKLDEASGGISSYSKPTGNVSIGGDIKLEYDLTGQKVAPTADIVSAGPGAGPHVSPEKKI